MKRQIRIAVEKTNYIGSTDFDLNLISRQLSLIGSLLVLVTRRLFIACEISNPIYVYSMGRHFVEPLVSRVEGKELRKNYYKSVTLVTFA